MENPNNFDSASATNIAPGVKVDFNTRVAFIEKKGYVQIEQSPFDLLVVLDYKPKPYEILYARVMQRQALRENNQLVDEDLNQIFNQAKYDKSANGWVRTNVLRLRNQIGQKNIQNDYRGRYYLLSP